MGIFSKISLHIYMPRRSCENDTYNQIVLDGTAFLSTSYCDILIILGQNIQKETGPAHNV